GAEVLINYADVNLKDALRLATDGRGVDIIYDCVGGEHSERALRATAWNGRFLVIGFASGDIPKLPANLLLLKGCAAIGVFWGEFVKRHPEAHTANVTQTLAWVANGGLKPHVHAVFPLTEICHAIGVLDRREATGKVVITV